MEKKVLHPTEAGTPQGGICSPVIANLALDSLEARLRTAFPRYAWKEGKKSCPKVNFIRLADDFVITGATKELLEDEVNARTLPTRSSTRVATRSCRLAAIPTSSGPPNSTPPSTAAIPSPPAAAPSPPAPPPPARAPPPRTSDQTPSAPLARRARAHRRRRRAASPPRAAGNGAGRPAKRRWASISTVPLPPATGESRCATHQEAQRLGLLRETLPAPAPAAPGRRPRPPYQAWRQLELRLDQHHPLRPRAQPEGQPAQHAPRRHEADVDREEVERARQPTSATGSSSRPAPGLSTRGSRRSRSCSWPCPTSTAVTRAAPAAAAPR